MRTYPTLIKLTEGHRSWPPSHSMDKEDYQSLIEFVKTHCGPYIKESQGIPVYRGLKRDAGHVPHTRTVRRDRQPMDTSATLHARWNRMIVDRGLKAHRGNSIFTTSDFKLAAEFGDVFFVIPMGAFHYTWSPAVKDAADNNGSMYGLTSPVSFMVEFVVSINNAPKTDTERHVMKELCEQPIVARLLRRYRSPGKWEEAIERLSTGPHDPFLDRYFDATPEERVKCTIRAIMYAVAGDTDGSPFQLTYEETEQVQHELTSFIHDLAASIAWKGDDGSLVEALHSGHEIMISCDEYLALPTLVYDAICLDVGMKKV